jgi:hypothetical protein
MHVAPLHCRCWQRAPPQSRGPLRARYPFAADPGKYRRAARRICAGSHSVVCTSHRTKPPDGHAERDDQASQVPRRGLGQKERPVSQERPASEVLQKSENI